MTCPSCGKPNPDEARYCLHCATPLGAGAVVASVDPQRAALERALGAQYEIGRLLGRGGMGAVYLARERALERAVAIKVLPPDMAADAESRERFRREARTAARLTHPSIVPLHTFGEVEGMLYFVMGYVRGESLGDRLARAGRLPADDVRRVVAELAEALDYAHRQGVVHRDIKPDNVLLDDESGRAMLTDFGVAKARAGGATLTEAGAVVGTPHYMSPEQASGARDLDGRSDLYSLGVMAYQMLSGRLPFEGESLKDVIVKQVAVEPVRLNVLMPDAPGPLTDAINRCLRKAPAARWPDGRALREALLVDDDDQRERSFWLRAIDGEATEWLIAAVVWGFFGLTYPLLETSTRSGLLRIGLLGTGLVVLTDFATVVGLRLSGHRWSRIRRLILRPKRWWSMWWPRAWRRDGDAWDRLPAALRRSRIVHTLMVGQLLLLAASVLYLLGLPPGHSPQETAGGWLFLGNLFLIPVILFGNAVALHLWGRKHGLTYRELSWAASRPTSAPIWKQRVFAALLAPPAGGVVRTEEPHAPRDYVRAIADAANLLADPVREIGIEAVAAARQLVDAMQSLDAEITQLARDTNPAELAQVEQKLAALGDASSDNDPRRRMRALIEGQRVLLRGLADQLDAATQRRAQLDDLLRTLWLQVANLRAEAAFEARAEADTTGRIRALCQEIARHADAAVMVRELAP